MDSIAFAPAIPYGSPRRLPIEAVCIGACLAPPLSLLTLLTCVSDIGVDQRDRVLLWVIAQGTIALAAAESRSMEDTAMRVFSGQIGTMTLGAFVLLRGQVEPVAQADPTTLGFVLLLATFAGAVAGGGLASWQFWLLCAVRVARSSPSHEATVRTTQTVCARLAAANALALGVVALQDSRARAVAIFGVLGPAAVAAACALRRALLRRWLVQVEAGRIEGWELATWRPTWSKLDLLPVFGDPPTAEEEPRVLVHTAKAEHPFRGADWVVPVALAG